MHRGQVRQALDDLIDRSPELLVVGLLANGPTTLVLWLDPDLRTNLFYGVWGGVVCGFAFLNDFQTRAEIEEGKEPKAWKTIIVIQVAYVLAVRVLLDPGGG